MHIFKKIFLAFTVSLFVVSTIQAKTVDHDSLEDALQFLQQFEPEVVSSEQKLAFKEFLWQLRDKRVVFVGEQHDRYDHHLLQLAVIQAMHAKNPRLAIGLEWFQQSFQAELDKYLAGQLTIQELLHNTEYYERWRYDFRQLKPVLEFAKRNKIPLLALNAQSEITSKVSQGGLEALSVEERQQIPATIHPAEGKYLRYLQGVFDKHMKGQGNPDRFMLVQRIWDETMTMNIVSYLNQHPQDRMVVLTGSGHSTNGTAIPMDLARELPKLAFATVFATRPEEITPDEFDYYVLTQEITLPATGKLGVWLDYRPDQGLFIKELAENSAAAKAGLQAEDQIIQVEGTDIQSMADLLLILAEKLANHKVNVTVKRKDTTHHFTVTLQ